MFKRLLRSQTGFSIIQGMMLAAAVAGMAYVGTKLTTDQKLAQKGAESKGRVEQLHSMIYSIMQNKDHCTQTFNNYIVVAPSTNPFLRAIWTKGNAAQVFEVNVNAGSGTYNQNYVYMNNSVTINDMKVAFPADLSQHADLNILYGKVSSKDLGSRTGKGYGGTTVRKTIKIKIQRNTATNAFESCYAVDEIENQNMVKDFCEGLGADNNPTTPNLFEWDATHQKCVLKDTQCPSGQIFTGFDSNGQRLCYAIQNWMNFNDLIDSTATDCNLTTNSVVRFGIVGTKAQIQCGATCTNSCDCAGGPGMNCESGLCVNRGSAGPSPGCPNGSYPKGDLTGRYWCSGGNMAYQASPPAPAICSAGPSCTTSCDCAGGPGMICEGGYCVDRGPMGTGCTNGTYGKGDASCRFICSGGMWACAAQAPPTPGICGCVNTCAAAGYGCEYSSNDPNAIVLTTCGYTTKYCSNVAPASPQPYICTF